MIQNYTEIFTFLLLVHILGDFYFQSESMAIKKEKDIKWVVYHSIVYGIVTLLFIKMMSINFDNKYIFILVVSHFIIDAIKFFIIKRHIIKKYENYIFSIDQLLHIIILVFVSYLLIKSNKVYRYNLLILDILNIMGLSISVILSIILKILLIHKPVNIFIVSIMKSYKPVNKKEKNTIRAGRMIGTFERIIMLFFLSIQQYSSIGLVLTAKSIARYNKISEDQIFAEYYLLGTLLSTICVLLISII